LTAEEIVALANYRLPAPATHLPWTGPVLRGRPVTVLKGRRVDVQTVVWVIAARRPVPPLYTVRSTCGTPRCVRAEHLRAEAPARTGYTPLTWLGEPAEYVPDERPPDSTCARAGHDLLDLANLVWREGRRRCRACIRIERRSQREQAHAPESVAS